MINPNADIERELAAMASGTMRAAEVLEASARVMAVAPGAQWSRAASHHGRALYAVGRLAEGFAVMEEAWQRADSLDDPLTGAIATRMGAVCCFMLYDYAQSEQWCRRELERRRSRVSAALRAMLSDQLAAACAAQGKLVEAREVLSEWEGAASRHYLLAYHEGDWERCVILLRKDFDCARAAGKLAEVAAFGSALGRVARIGNQRVQAEAILDESLQASLTAPDLTLELFIRIELAIINSDLGQFRRAREELHRCREILDNGEDWRGHQGAFLHIVALVQAAEHILKFVSPDGRWHVALHHRTLLLPEEIAQGFRAAIEIFRRYHAPWEETAALLYWSQALFAASQIRQSFEKFEAAFAIFDKIATPRWNERIQIDLFRFITLDSLSAPITVGDGAGANVFRKDGEHWTISYRGSLCMMRDTIGMHYIRHLVANPGLEFTAQEMVEIVQRDGAKRSGPKSGRASRRNGHPNGGQRDDPGRERARLMVTKRIKDVIGRIRQAHPELARHLATSIRTGYSCRYIADEEHATAWLT